MSKSRSGRIKARGKKRAQYFKRSDIREREQNLKRGLKASRATDEHGEQP